MKREAEMASQDVTFKRTESGVTTNMWITPLNKPKQKLVFQSDEAEFRICSRALSTSSW